MGVLSVYRRDIDERDLLQLLRNDVICRLLKDPGGCTEKVWDVFRFSSIGESSERNPCLRVNS